MGFIIGGSETEFKYHFESTEHGEENLPTTRLPEYDIKGLLALFAKLSDLITNTLS